MNWDKIKKLTRPQDEMEDDDSVQIADEQSLPSKIYETVSPALDMIIPSAEAKNLSQFSPREYLENKRQQPTFNPKQYLQQASQPKQQEPQSKKQQVFIKPTQEEIKQFITDEARKRGEDPALVLAHFEKESSFNPGAYNKEGGGTGARGLSQIRSQAFQEVQNRDKTGEFKKMKHEEMSDPKNWKKNIEAGLNYYDVVKKYWKPKSTKDFLKNYNQGSFKGKKYDPKAAEEYANDVFSRYHRNKQYIDKLDAQRALSSVNIDSGEELAADKVDIFKNIKKLMRP